MLRVFGTDQLRMHELGVNQIRFLWWALCAALEEAVCQPRMSLLPALSITGPVSVAGPVYYRPCLLPALSIEDTCLSPALSITGPVYGRLCLCFLNAHHISYF